MDDALASEARCASVVIVSEPATTWTSLSRPVIRDGLHVARRDDRHLQIGLDPPDRLVLTDRPGLYDALTRPGSRAADDVLDVLDRLVADGWVVDAAATRRHHSPGFAGGVAVTADPLVDDALERALAASSLRRREDAPVRLVATVGEPRRGLADTLVRDDVAHLWLAVAPAWARIGPYVEPGRSACLRCLDAHLHDRDPRRATVLHQWEDLPAPPASALDPCLVQIAVAWAVADVVRRLEGHDSSLRSATVTVSRRLEATRREWLRHPACGCAWG